MKNSYEIADDPFSNKVKVQGLDEFVQRSGITIAKLNKISGLSRNTITKVIGGEAVRPQTVETLVNAMEQAGMFGNVEQPAQDSDQSTDEKVHHLWQGDDQKNGQSADPDLAIPQMLRDLQALNTRYQALYRGAYTDRKSVNAEELHPLKVEWEQLQALHRGLMDLYGLK